MPSRLLAVCERLGFGACMERLTESGNCDLRGVRAAATFRADRRSVSRTFHSLFLAMKKRVAVETKIHSLASAHEYTASARCRHTANNDNDDHDDNNGNHASSGEVD